MANNYIVNYEIWVSNTFIGWGNLAVTHKSIVAPNATELYEAMREYASKQATCNADQIRIVGVFKL